MCRRAASFFSVITGHCGAISAFSSREWLPLFRHVVFVEDRFDRALGHAGFAVDAFVRMDVENLLAFVEALHRANHHTIGVLAAKARFANDVRHE